MLLLFGAAAKAENKENINNKAEEIVKNTIMRALPIQELKAALFSQDKKNKKDKDKEQKDQNKNEQDERTQLKEKDIEEILNYYYKPGAHTFSELQDAVDFASEETGVRKDFLMGMLVVESDLGRNVGECTYEEIEEDARKSYENGRLGFRAWRTFLRRKEVMKGIAKKLDYDLNKTMVSCNPSKYIGTGGAMGVAQFMPDTWMEYRKRIARVVGKAEPDPWNIRDGVVAMALKLSDVPGVTAHRATAEANAAKLYLSGTTSWRYNWYANQILYWARNYHKLVAA